MILPNKVHPPEQPQPRLYRLWLFCAVFLLFTSDSLLRTTFPAINEPHYLAKARAVADPDWCSRDFFLTSKNAHYCFLQLIGPFAARFSFFSVSFAGRLLCLVILSSAWLRLGSALLLSPVSAVAGASFFVLISQTGNFSGEWILGGFESKVPAWALGLFAVSGWITALRQQRTKAVIVPALCNGAAISLHPVVGAWFAIAVFFGALIALALERQRRLRTHDNSFLPSHLITMLATYTLFTTVAAMPGLIPALGFLAGSDLPQQDLDRASFIQVFWRLSHHLDPRSLSLKNLLFAAVVTGLAVVCSKRLTETRCEQSVRFRLLMCIFAVSGLIAGLGLVAGWHKLPVSEMTNWQWKAKLLRFYPFRLFDGLLPIYLGVALAALLQPRLATVGRQQMRTMIACFVVVPICTAALQRPASPAGFTPQQHQDWVSMCRWIRNETPNDALVLTPRESLDFKWFAERAEYVCYKDCPQDAAGILEWDRRLWFLHEWTLESSSDGRYDKEDLLELNRRTGCDFLVTRILGPFSSQPIHTVGEWSLYRVPAVSTEAAP